MMMVIYIIVSQEMMNGYYYKLVLIYQLFSITIINVRIQ